jgi:serine/threonine-protein kinase
VPPGERLVHALADAILDGTPIDWAAAESSSDSTTRLLVRQLRVLAAVAELHCSTPPGAWSASRMQTRLEPHSAQAPVLWRHLRLFERIGRGAFGEVYRAWDTRLEREVALKLLPAVPSSGDRAAFPIVHEGRLLARVRHPNVVTIFGVEQVGDQIGLSMEFIRGRTLEQMLEQNRAAETSEAIDIGIQLCRAMSAVHGAGLLHRDIKTTNVMRAEDGRVVLMDFGAGREFGDDVSSDVAGTPLYLAPEVLAGQPATVRSDIYSIGVLLYRLVTGAFPVQAGTVCGLRDAHARGKRIAIQNVRADVPSSLARIIERAIAPRPARRYPTADALSADLAALARSPGLAGLHSSGAAGILAVARPVVAVLPFTIAGGASEMARVREQLTDAVTRHLGAVQELEVRVEKSTSAFKGKRTAFQIARHLGAHLIVDGSVERDGTRLRITWHVTHVAEDILLCADCFERELEDAVSACDEIARALVHGLRPTLGTRGRRRAGDLNACELYLQARALVDRRGLPNVQKAAELFRRAIALDPRFAPAHAGLAHAYALMTFPYRGIAFERACPAMRAAARKAMQLNPLLAESHAAMGWVYSFAHDWANAEKAFRQAIRLDPNRQQSYTSYSLSTLQPLRKFDEALRLLQSTSRHNRPSLDVMREIGEVQLFAGQYAAAVDTFDRVTDTNPDFPFVQAYLGKALAFAGRGAEAVPRLELEQGSPWLAHAYVITGARAEAEELAARSEAYSYRLAVTSGALGDTELAVAAVERAAGTEPQRLGRLLIEPELRGLRDDPRVMALRTRFGLP